MGPKILYTTGAGEGVKVSVATFWESFSLQWWWCIKSCLRFQSFLGAVSFCRHATLTLCGSTPRISRWKSFLKMFRVVSGVLSHHPPKTWKGAGEQVPCEKCRKVSKIFLTLFDVFWLFLPCGKSVEKCRKYFWHFLLIFDVFWRGPFPAGPFCAPLTFLKRGDLCRCLRPWLLSSGACIQAIWLYLQGRKKYTPLPWRPPFFLFPGLRLYGVYHLSRNYYGINSLWISEL